MFTNGHKQKIEKKLLYNAMCYVNRSFDVKLKYNHSMGIPLVEKKRNYRKCDGMAVLKKKNVKISNNNKNQKTMI